MVWETWVTSIPCTLPSDLGLFYPVIYVHYSLVEFKLLRCKNITKHDILNKCIHYLSVKLFVVHPVMVYISEGFLANIMYMGLFKHCKPTCIRSDFISWFTGDKLVHGSLFSRSRCILSGEKKIKRDIWKLVHCEKLSRWQGSNEPCKNFSRVNKSWFTAFIDSMHYNLN